LKEKGREKFEKMKHKNNNDFFCDFTCRKVMEWMRKKRFENHMEKFANYDGSDLLNLSRRLITSKCGFVDGIRLFNLLRSEEKRDREETVKIRYIGEYGIQSEFGNSQSPTVHIDQSDESLIIRDQSEESLAGSGREHGSECSDGAFEDSEGNCEGNSRIPDYYPGMPFSRIPGHRITKKSRTYRMKRTAGNSPHGEQITVNRIRNVIADLTDNDLQSIGRIIIDKQDRHGRTIKVVMTDQYLMEAQNNYLGRKIKQIKCS
jgi:hypothetical protein